jgi:hypothetical protein
MSLFLFLSYLLSAKSNYCSCLPLPPIDDKQYNECSLIARGKVVKIAFSNLGENIYLALDTCYKGDEKQRTINIISLDSEGICGIFPKVGEQWLVFAYRQGKTYTTNLCTRTKDMNPKAWNYNESVLTNDLKFLRAKLTNNSR